MSSKRGRKRNDNLPPNRARDVQRAFRARRAAHLEALEQRVSELEEENSTLRAALNLPPASRPALGKGPTGKDKPKPYAASASSSRAQAGASGSLDSISHEDSSPESPSSTRAQSLSPATITATMRPSPHPVHSLEGGGGSWDQGMLMEPEQPQPAPHASPPSAGYPLSSITTHGKASYTSYPSPIPPSRPNLPGTMFLGSTSPSAQNFSNATERPMADAYGGTSAGYPLRDIRDDPPPQQPPQQQPQHFSYSQSPFSTPDPGHIHHSAQSSSMQMHPQRDAPPSQSSMQYPQPHRRSITEPQAQYRSSQYPLPTSQTSSTMRRPSSPRLPEGSHLRPQYGGGGG